MRNKFSSLLKEHPIWNKVISGVIAALIVAIVVGIFSFIFVHKSEISERYETHGNQSPIMPDNKGTVTINGAPQG